MFLLLFFKGLNTYTKPHALNLDLSNVSFIHLKVMTLTGDHFQFSRVWTSYLSLAGIQVPICIHIYTYLQKEGRRKHTWWGSTKISLVRAPMSHFIYRHRTWVDSQEIFITCTPSRILHLHQCWEEDAWVMLHTSADNPVPWAFPCRVKFTNTDRVTVEGPLAAAELEEGSSNRVNCCTGTTVKSPQLHPEHKLAEELGLGASSASRSASKLCSHG